MKQQSLLIRFNTGFPSHYDVYKTEVLVNLPVSVMKP